MNLIQSHEELFVNLLYDYLKKNGLSRTAETFLKETQLTGQIRADFDQHEHPHGFLYGVWNTFCDKYNSRQLTPGTLVSQSQAPNIGAIMDTTSQILREAYSIQHLSSFPRGCPESGLSSCDFSSDGKIVASGGLGGGKPFLCNLKARASVTTSESHSFSIYEVRFQPGSTIFATSSYDTVKLWDTDGNVRSVFDFVGHKGIIRSLDFHPLKGILCSSDTQNKIIVWDLNRHSMVNAFEENGSKVRFQPGPGKHLAVANKNVLNILDYENSTVVKRFQGHIKNICSICWDVNGNWIASASEDDVHVWSLELDGPCIYECPSNGKKLNSIIFHPRYHNVLVIGSSQGMDLLLLVIDVRGIRIKHVSDLPTTGLAACVQKQYIASTTTTDSNDSVVNIWK